jgi:hypothetical protein
MAALTQADVDKLKLAIARGVRSVTYASGTVVYQSTADMLRALAFAEQELAGKHPPSTLAVFGRD